MLTKIAESLDGSPGDVVVEIGPGRGALTDELVRRGFRVTAIEIDRDLVAQLRDRYSDVPEVRIVAADVLDVPLGSLADSYRLVGNVPYYITTPILFHALRPPLPLTAVFLVQKEVAERLAATPASRAYGALSVNVQATMLVESLGRVKAGAFHPPPTVESAIVRLTPLAEPVVAAGNEQRLREFVIAVFGQRRKTMLRVLRHVRRISAVDAERALEAVGISGARRPETLSPAEFASLQVAVDGSPPARRA
ncbi:MAG: Ribosomal RNA small subunit methyltransferase A [Gemmatimonadaceae bacterium]|nr:Ribosomal RNA small subunit methyltransferase A [Gemmatimonadaceae bacterium]